MLTFKSYIKETFEICEAAESGLAAKAEKSGISIGTLRKVYNRGMAAWKTGHRPGTTPQQWGMARVNSYITKGKGTYHGADKDLREGSDAVELLTKRLTKPMSYDAIDDIMKSICKDCGMTPKQLHNSFVEKHGKTPDDYAKGMTEAVAKDKESGLPKKYVAGVSTSTAKARAAHFEKNKEKSDSDPEAYKPAPGDANSKTKESKHTKKYREMFGESAEEELYEACWNTHKQVGVKKKGSKMVPDCVPKNEEMSVEEKFDVIEEMVMTIAEEQNIDPENIWEKFESINDEELFEAAIDAKGYKSSTGGLTQKGRDAYNAKGGNLQAPVTTPPSKLKPGSKAANRRKSFCARMSGVDGPMKDDKGRPTRKALALRKWNC